MAIDAPRPADTRPAPASATRCDRTFGGRIVPCAGRPSTSTTTGNRCPGESEFLTALWHAVALPRWTIGGRLSPVGAQQVSSSCKVCEGPTLGSVGREGVFGPVCRRASNPRTTGMTRRPIGAEEMNSHLTYAIAQERVADLARTAHQARRPAEGMLPTDHRPTRTALTSRPFASAALGHHGPCDWVSCAMRAERGCRSTSGCRPRGPCPLIRSDRRDRSGGVSRADFAEGRETRPVTRASAGPRPKERRFLVATGVRVGAESNTRSLSNCASRPSVAAPPIRWRSHDHSTSCPRRACGADGRPRDIPRQWRQSRLARDRCLRLCLPGRRDRGRVHRHPQKPGSLASLVLSPR